MPPHGREHNNNATRTGEMTTNTHIMRSDVDVAELLRLTITDALHVLQQNELKPWTEHLQQRVPISDTPTTVLTLIITVTRGQRCLANGTKTDKGNTTLLCASQIHWCNENLAK